MPSSRSLFHPARSGSSFFWKLRIWLLPTFLFAVLSNQASAQPKWFFYPYENPPSVSDDRIRDLLIARDGSVWVGIWGSGAVRLEPRTWREFHEGNGLASNWVRCLEEDYSGNVWIGTINGLICHTSGENFYNFTVGGELSIPDDSVYSLQVFEDGTLWVGTESGLLLATQTKEIDRNDFRGSFPGWETVADRTKTKGGKVRDILATRQGEIWVALGEKGFARFHPGEEWEYIEGEAEFENSSDLLFEDHAGTLYSGMRGGLYRREGEAWTRIEKVGNYAASVATSPTGDLFVGCEDGLHIRDDNGWRKLLLPLTIGSPTISSIAFDKKGGLWLGTYEGLIRGAEVPWESVPLPPGESVAPMTLDLHPEQPTYALTHPGGLVRLATGETWHKVAVAGSTGETPVWLGREGDTRLWALFTQHLVEISLPEEKVLRKIPLPEDVQSPSRLSIPAPGEVWVIARKEWLEYREGVLTARYDVREEESGRAEEVLWHDEDSRLLLFELGSLLKKPTGMEPLENIYPEFAGVHVKCGLRLSDGRIWIGTYGEGILEIDQGAVRPISYKDGLQSEHVSQLFEASDGTIWVAYRRKGIASLRDGRWVHYAHEQGLPNGSINRFGETSDGAIWAIDSRLNVRRYRADKNAPDTSLVAYPSQVGYRQSALLTFRGRDAWHRTLVSRLEYSWRSRPVGTEESGYAWSPFSRTTTAVLEGLKPGTYWFEVRASDFDRNIDPTPAAIQLTVQPPLWQLPAFLYPLSILGVITLALIALALRKQRDLVISEAALQERVEFEGLIASLSRDFINLEGGRIDGEIETALARVARYLGFTRAFILRTEGGTRHAFCTHFWQEVEGAFGRENLKAIDCSQFPATFNRLFDREVIEIHRIEESSITQGIEKDYWKASGARSALVVPMLAKGNLLGALCFESKGSTMNWPADFVTLLKLLGEVFANVLERRAAQEELRRQEALLDQTQAISKVGGWEYDVQRKRTYWTEEVYRIHEVPPNFEPTPFNVLEFFPEECRSEVQEGLAKVIKQGGRLDIEVPFRTATGRRLWVRLVGEAEAEEGKIKRVFGILQDITRVKREQEEKRAIAERMQQVQKLESLGVLTGGIAHDFNNILVGILGNTSLAMEEIDRDSPAQESLVEIEKASRRAADLIRQMLAYSGQGKFLIELINLNRLIGEMTELLKFSLSKKALLEIDFSEQAPLIEGDATQIRQIVMNLMTNASEALQDAPGTITIRTGIRDCSADDLESIWNQGTQPPGKYSFLEVSDTGAGMDRETRSRMFDPFFSTKFTGRGLGLAAVLGIVHSHHGVIKVDSRQNVGTRFEVYFPYVAHQEPERSGAENRPPKPWFGEGTLLLVDDEEAIRTFAGRVLTNAGFEVLTAADGEEAIRVFHENADRISCVVLDLTMPRMDGHQTLRILKETHPHLPVLLSSGFDEQRALGSLEDMEGLGFISKPYPPFEILEKLQRLLK